MIDERELPPDVRLVNAATSLAGMRAAGELDAPTDDTKRALAHLEMFLLDIAGDVRLLRVPEGRANVVSFRARVLNVLTGGGPGAA